jgi:hypothetical protein
MIARIMSQEYIHFTRNSIYVQPCARFMIQNTTSRIKTIAEYNILSFKKAYEELMVIEGCPICGHMTGGGIERRGCLVICETHTCSVQRHPVSARFHSLLKQLSSLVARLEDTYCTIATSARSLIRHHCPLRYLKVAYTSGTPRNRMRP